MATAPLRALAVGAILASALTTGFDSRAQNAAPYPAPPPPPPAPPAGAPSYASAPPPYSASPAPARPLAGTPTATASVRYEGEPGVSLMVRTGTVPTFHWERRFRHVWYGAVTPTALYSPMCDAPCSIALAPGTYDLALSKEGGRAVRPDAPVTIPGPATLRAEYTDRSGLRTLGAVIGIAGIIGGVVMLVAAADAQTVCEDAGRCTSENKLNDGLILGGVATIVGSIVIGSILALQQDTAAIYVTPLSVGRAREGDRTASAIAPPQGAMLGVRF